MFCSVVNIQMTLNHALAPVCVSVNSRLFAEMFCRGVENKALYYSTNIILMWGCCLSLYNADLF